MIPKGRSNDSKLDSQQKGSHKRKELIIMRPFSPVSTKDSFRVVMALVAHFDMELHQMDVKTAFLNGDLNETIFMAQPEDFAIKGKEYMGCKLKKSIYGLKQASNSGNSNSMKLLRNSDLWKMMQIDASTLKPRVEN